MKLSVVVATHNRKESLRCCLHSLQDQTLAATELIVVDDGSDDGTAEMVQQEFPAVRLVRQDTNCGPATARNKGLLLATGEIVAFTDDDCLPSPEWLQLLCRGFENYPGVVGVGGYQEASHALIETNPVARADHLMRLQRWGARAFHPQRGGAEIPGLGTNNVAYRRDALLAVNGFDESFPVAAGEDTDLKVRVSQLAVARPSSATNGPLLYLPLKMRHARVYTLQAQWRMALKRGVGAYYFESKHGRAPGLARLLLRCAKRSLQFVWDLWQHPWPVAWAMYVTRIGDCLGQFKMAVGKA